MKYRLAVINLLCIHEEWKIMLLLGVSLWLCIVRWLPLYRAHLNETVAPTYVLNYNPSLTKLLD